MVELWWRAGSRLPVLAPNVDRTSPTVPEGRAGIREWYVGPRGIYVRFLHRRLACQPASEWATCQSFSTAKHSPGAFLPTHPCDQLPPDVHPMGAESLSAFSTYFLRLFRPDSSDSFHPSDYHT